MEIGKLNRRVEILAYQEIQDKYGGEVGEWIKVKEVWASIKPVSGTEYFRSDKAHAENTTTITIRYNPIVTVLNRIRYEDKTYEIIGANDTETSHVEMVLNCKEIIKYGI